MNWTRSQPRSKRRYQPPSVPLSSWPLSDVHIPSSQIEGLESILQPLRTGAPPISEAEVLQLDIEWTRWRSEWAARKKVFQK